MANAQESELHYVFDEQLPETGRTLPVAAGVRWLRMRLPFALDHINLWLLRDHEDTAAGRREGWAIVDCGIDNAATRAAWEQIFATQLDGMPVLRVICTHMHPDHIGLAHWLTERWSGRGAGPPAVATSAAGGPRSGTAASAAASHDCRLWISATDWYAARWASAASADAHSGDGAAAFFARHGLTDEESLAQVRARRNYYSGMVPKVPTRYRRLMHDMVLPIGAHEWRCIAGYGHAPEHIALHCPALNTLISGDMVLPRISTNVSVMDFEPEANPLPLYLQSIAALRALPADTLVLPSHGKPFTGLHRRIAQLTRHHDERYDEVLRACAERPHSAAELLDVLFKRRLDLHQTTFAMGEAVAHVHALAAQGKLAATSGADGVIRFATV